MQFGRSWPLKVVKVIFLGTKNKTAPSPSPPPPPSCALWGGRRGFFWLWRFCVLCFFLSSCFRPCFRRFSLRVAAFSSLARPLATLFVWFFCVTILLRLSSRKKSTRVLRLFPSLPDLVLVRSFVTLCRALDLERLYFRCRWKVDDFCEEML